MIVAPATTPISTGALRAEKDAVGAAIGALVASGVPVALARRGARDRRAGRPAPLDRTVVERMRPEIAARLAEPGAADPEELLEQLDVEIELVDDAERAREVIAGLPTAVAIDLETMARLEFATEPPWLAVTRDGRRAARQPKPDKTGLDPLRAQPRLIQVFDAGRSAVFIFDMTVLCYADLAGLFERKVLMHNAMFDLAALAAQGVEPRRYFDTLQLAACAFGTGAGARKLAPSPSACSASTCPRTSSAAIGRRRR